VKEYLPSDPRVFVPNNCSEAEPTGTWYSYTTAPERGLLNVVSEIVPIKTKSAFFFLQEESMHKNPINTKSLTLFIENIYLINGNPKKFIVAPLNYK
jgi:hypothetical protein